MWRSKAIEPGCCWFDSQLSHARVVLCLWEAIASIKSLIKQIGGWLVNEQRPSGELLLISEAISVWRAANEVSALVKSHTDRLLLRPAAKTLLRHSEMPQTTSTKAPPFNLEVLSWTFYYHQMCFIFSSFLQRLVWTFLPWWKTSV